MLLFFDIYFTDILWIRSVLLIIFFDTVTGYSIPNITVVKQLKKDMVSSFKILRCSYYDIGIDID